MIELKALEEEYEAEEEMEAEAASEAGEIMEKRSEDDLASFYAGRGKRGQSLGGGTYWMT